jgi:hypothetical protein
MAVPGLEFGNDAAAFLARRSAAKAANNAIAPGAGVTVLKDIGK